MVTVYVVTSGSYSDYDIERVFLNHAEATRFVEVSNSTGPWADYEIEEYGVTELGEPVFTHTAAAEVCEDGIEYRDIKKSVTWPPDEVKTPTTVYAYPEFKGMASTRPRRVSIRVTEKDAERATKILTDMAVQIAAEFDASYSRISPKRS